MGANQRYWSNHTDLLIKLIAWWQGKTCHPLQRNAMSKMSEIDALLEERKGYLLRNLPKRVASVDDALKTLGYAVKETASVVNDDERSAIPVATKRTVKK